MIERSRTGNFALAALLMLAACGRGEQVPGMDAKDLSDDRGAKAGRFHPAPSTADNIAATDNSPTMENNQ